ncbi:hypothetical protein SprV_0401697500 [Sparganum proliferum]
MPDPRDGRGRWSLEALMPPAETQTDNRVVCLRPGRRSNSQADPFSLLDEEEEGNAIDSGSSSTGRNLSARLWSSKIRTLDGTPVQCLKLAYQIVLGEPSSVEELPVISGSPNLAMLRHSSGSCHELFDHHLKRTVRICEPQSLWSKTSNVSDSWHRASIDIGTPTVDDFKSRDRQLIASAWTPVRVGRVVIPLLSSLFSLSLLVSMTILFHPQNPPPPQYRSHTIIFRRCRSCREIYDPETQRKIRICEPSPIWQTNENVASGWLNVSINLESQTPDDFKSVFAPKKTIPLFSGCRAIEDRFTGETFKVCKPTTLWNASTINGLQPSLWQKTAVDLNSTGSEDFKGLPPTPPLAPAVES